MLKGDASRLMEAVPSSRRQGTLHDLLGRFTVRHADPRRLVIEGPLAPGRYVLSLSTRAGTFASESLMLDLLEWPSLRTVPSGPFDFDHTEYRMVVPTVRIYVDGEDQGLAWAQVPSPTDMAARLIRLEAGFEARGAAADDGCCSIELALPEDEHRLRFADIERMTLHVDPRSSLATPSRGALGAGQDEPTEARPRLFADASMVDALGQQRGPLREAVWQDLVAQLESGYDGTYAHRTVTAALVGRITGERRWIDEAVARTLAVCDRPIWGYHDVREVMGWNNDRDTGMRLFETACVYDWLHEHLTSEQRSRIAERLAHFAAIVDRATRVQFGYWYTRSNEAHGQGVWFGLAATAVALLGDDARAQRWLDWAHGNIVDAATYLPDDGIVEWPVFNIQWLIMTVMLLERFTGRPLAVDRAPLVSFMRQIPQYGGAIGHSGGPALPLLLFYLASTERDLEAQADAAGRIHRRAQRNGAAHGLHPLTLLAIDETMPQGAATAPEPALCSDSGVVLCRTTDGRASFHFRCGTPLSGRRHDSHGWNAQAWYGVGHSGAFSWTVGRATIIPAGIKTYRRTADQCNLVSIDGGGHRLETRYLGGLLPLRHASRIELFATSGDVTYCHADSSEAYRDRCDVRRLFRQWVFLHDVGVLVMRDVAELAQPHALALHVNTGGQWESLAPELFLAGVRDAELFLRVLPVEPGAGGVAATIGPAAYVPTYTSGINRYRTMDWQPELNKEHRPADYQQLTLAPPQPTARLEMVTVMALDRAWAESAAVRGDAAALEVELNAGLSVTWAKQPGALPIRTLGAAPVPADVLVTRGEDKPALAFGLDRPSATEGQRAWRGEAVECPISKVECEGVTR